MYEHVKTGCKHIPPSEQPLQFQSGYYLNKPRRCHLQTNILVRNLASCSDGTAEFVDVAAMLRVECGLQWTDC